MSTSGLSQAERIHAIVSEQAPDLLPKTWYGMPAYATTDGEVVCFSKASSKFGERYSTLGFNHEAPAGRRHDVGQGVRRHGPREGRGRRGREAGDEGAQLNTDELRPLRRSALS